MYFFNTTPISFSSIARLSRCPKTREFTQLDTRVGLAIHCTSATIDGNFEEARTVVLEIKNQGPFDIILRHKIAVAMLSFHQLTSAIEQKTQTQYQGQDGVVAPNLKRQKQ